MRPLRRILLLLTVAALGLLPGAAIAAPPSAEAVCPPGTITETGSFNKGGLWKICMPESGWNGGLVVFGHGYQPPSRSLNFAGEEWGEQLLMPLAAEMGYAYAATSYRRNGLVVWDALKDNRALLAEFRRLYGRPERTLLVGQSLGGLIMTQLLERHPELADGALSLSGPIGGFREQIDYWGDFRVLFDYFFPELLPGSAVEVPAELAQNPDAYLFQQVLPVISDPASFPALFQLLALSGAAFDPANPQTAVVTTYSLLWFGLVSTGEAQAVLGGNMFDNSATDYGDPAVNAGVERFRADANALAALKRLETSGRPKRPLVIMHTTADPIVPFWHVGRYADKLDPALADNVRFMPPVERYGHVAFTPEEVLAAFAQLVALTQ